MGKKSSYHHGDLRRALLAAAEVELKQSGLDKFSLRGVARIADVSHAAPAHHFGDVTGLLTALAVVGWQRFQATQKRFESKAAAEPLEQLIAAASGYVAFAKRHPELFQLIFFSGKPDRCDASFGMASEAAFLHLVDRVSAVVGKDVSDHPDSMVDVYAMWAMVHGIASLLNNDFMSGLGDTRSERDAAIRSMLERYWLPS